MNAVELTLTGGSWGDTQNVPTDSPVLAVAGDYRVSLGRIHRLPLLLQDGTYTVVWDEDWTLQTLIDTKHQIEAKHGTGTTYFWRRPRRGDLRR